MKLDIPIANTTHTVPMAEATLWKCEGCSSLVGIQSNHSVAQPICPVCGSPTLDLCCHLPTLIVSGYGEA